MKDCKLTIPNASKIHIQNPLIAEYNNWLSAEEIKKILKLRKTLTWYQGNSANRVTRTRAYDPDIRIAENYKVGKNDRACLSSLGARVAAFFKLPNEHYIEPTLLVRYQVGGHFANHTDWWQAVNSKGEMTNRLATFMVYLNSDFEGGQTYFQNSDITIVPEPGKGLLFTYGSDYLNQHHIDSHHAGLPVLSGTKYVLLFFIRDNEFTDDLRETVRY